MTDVDEICRQISKTLNEDFSFVKNVVTSQFLFITNVMKDGDDTKDILINKLVRFKLKDRFKKNKERDYSPYEKDS